MMGRFVPLLFESSWSPPSKPGFDMESFLAFNLPDFRRVLATFGDLCLTLNIIVIDSSTEQEWRVARRYLHETNDSILLQPPRFTVDLLLLSVTGWCFISDRHY
jgi:hypothetical protein